MSEPRDGTPRLSAFSIVKNARIYDYPIDAALRSVLPLVDELLVDVGHSDDDTLDIVRAINDPRIRIFERDWGSEKDRTTSVHSEETNFVMDRCTHDWALYIQADEVLHEEDYEGLRAALREAADRPQVEGLVFDYVHFYGSPDWWLWGRAWYRREVRLVRRSSGVRSRAGAQGFKVPPGWRPVDAIPARARIFHYGYAKTLEALKARRRLWARYWSGDEEEWGQWEFTHPRELRPFTGAHPSAVRDWIVSREWPYRPEEYERPDWSYDEVRNWISDRVESATGWRMFEHRNYRLLD